jgi:hypothetical protein
LEAEYAVLNCTPLHRSEASSRDDLILAWALLGDFMHVMFFPASHLKSRHGTRGNLEVNLQCRAPDLAAWAGPAFEQTCLQSLFVLQSASAGVISLPGEKLFMAQYMPGDRKLFLPPIMFHGYGSAKVAIHDLDHFHYWFTLTEALGPVRDNEGKVLLPYILSPLGFFSDMGVKFLIEKLPSLSAFARTVREEGWKRGHVNVCPLIQASLATLEKFRPIVRPPWLTPTTVDSLAEKVEEVAGEKVKDEVDDSMQVDEPAVVIACPGLRCARLPDVEPHFSILNPDGLTSYGPSGKRAENFEHGKYQMPYYPAPTLHGLMMVLSSRNAASVWCSIGEKKLSKQLVAPLPSWWHLPSEAVTTALA